MDKIEQPRAIVDRRALVADLEQVYRDLSNATDRRAAVLARLKAALRQGTGEIKTRFEAHRAGAHRVGAIETIRAQSFLMDQILRTTYELAALREYPAHNPTTGDRLTMLAVGGYGRGELAPFSDIDLLFLFPYKQTPHVEQVVEWTLYLLWDLGLKVGHATRSVGECLRVAKQDFTIRTALLEARHLSGDQAVFQDFRRRFQDEIVSSTGREFVAAKLAERDARHKQLGDSRYVLEPNIKEGKGGLRDLQTLYWIGKYLYQVDRVADLVKVDVLTDRELRRFDKAAALLWTVRCHLHYHAGRADERLTFDAQPELARRMGYTDHAGTSGVERFMKHYYLYAKEVGDLTRIFGAAIEAARPRRWPRVRLPRFGLDGDLKGFRLESNMLTVTDDTAFVDDPVAMMRLFHVGHFTATPVHPHALRLVTRNLRRFDQAARENEEANRLFMQILAAKEGQESTLRQMNEAGLFGRFLPDFGRIVGQMQHDMYHVYTVDEHTIFAIGILNGIERGIYKKEHPVGSEVIHKTQSRRALYAAVLFHDIAKGRGGNHSIIGAELAERVGPRLGLTAEETESVAWLVRHHLAMSNTAFKRDLSDAKTIKDFAELVQSPERLRLLLCLTVADIRAVGPKVWNNWKAALLRELYYATEDLMSGGQAASDRDSRVLAAQDKLRGALADWPAADIDTHLTRGYPSYWLAFDPATLADHARQMRPAEADSQALSVRTKVDADRAVTTVTIYTQNHPGLFSRIARAFAATGANVVDARIFTTPHGMALDVFWIQDADGGAFAHPAALKRLTATIEDSLGGKLSWERGERRPTFVPSRWQVFNVPPRVIVDNKASTTHTVVEVNGRDRPGFLSAVTSALYELHLQISSAKISTYGERVVDVFYVKDGFGMKIEHETRLKRVREALLTAAEEPKKEPIAAE